LSELLRTGVQQLIHQAQESEFNGYLSPPQCLADDGMVAMVRNRYLPKQNKLSGIAPISFRIY
jgi:hypothetical protein